MSSSGLMTTSGVASSAGVMTSSEKKTSGYIPIDQSSSFEKPEYRSRFVEIQDEVIFFLQHLSYIVSPVMLLCPQL